MQVSYRGEVIADTPGTVAIEEGSYPVVFYNPRQDGPAKTIQ